MSRDSGFSSLRSIVSIVIPILVASIIVTPPISIGADQDIIYVPDAYPSIQSAIDSASEGDTIIVRSGTYRESLTIDKSLTLMGEENGIIVVDGLGDREVIDVDAPNMTLVNLVARNGVYSIRLSDSERSVIRDCVVYGCSRDGIHCQDSYRVSIINTACYYNKAGISLDHSKRATIWGSRCVENHDAGIKLYHSDNTWIRGCLCSSNADDGISLINSDQVLLENSECRNHTDDGIYLYKSDHVTIYNSSSYRNARALSTRH